MVRAMKQSFVLSHDEARRRAVQAVQDAPQGYAVIVKPPARNLEQNALLWALLADVSEEVVWHGRKLSPEAWKHIFTSSLKRQDVVPGLDGGFVVLGLSTSQMSKAEFSDLIELIHVFRAQQMGAAA